MVNGRPARWNLPPALSADLAGASLAERVWWSRGHRDSTQIERFLAPRVEHLHDPLALRDMDRAVERLCRAIRDGESILLYGDYDVDGTTSVVVLRTTL
jgi:single-stranded-DNA-specific exonuclease